MIVDERRDVPGDETMVDGNLGRRGAQARRALAAAAVVALTCGRAAVANDGAGTPAITAPLDGGLVADIGPLDASFKYAWAPSAVELPNGDLLCVWYGGRAEADSGSGTYYAVRPRGTTAWTPPRPLFNDPAVNEMNPVVDLAGGGNDVVVYYQSFVGRYNTNVFHGTDLSRLAATYDPGTRTLSVAGGGGAKLVGLDGQVLRPALEPNSAPAKLADGTLVLGVTNKTAAEPGVLRSTDGGRRWAYHPIPQNAPGDPTQPKASMPAVRPLPDGTLLAYLRCYTPGPKDGNARPDYAREFMWQSTSADGGVTWTPPAPTPLKNPNARAAFLVLADGTRIVAHNDMHRPVPDTASGRRRLDLSRSMDGGRTWASRTIAYDPAGEIGYPSLAEGAGGAVHVVYGSRPTAIRFATVNAAWFDAPRP